MGNFNNVQFREEMKDKIKDALRTYLNKGSIWEGKPFTINFHETWYNRFMRNDDSIQVTVTGPLLPHLRDLHDEWGNCEELVSEDIKEKLEAGNFYRASGDCICNECGKTYYQHPHVLGALWLRILCNEDLVKL